MKESRLRRERETITRMMQIYCRANHKHRKGLCEQCQEQLEYAMERIQRCPYKEKKPACKKCNIHCYKPDAAKKTREIMRFSGPRMFIYHPVLAIKHLIDLMRF